ncbi:MAG: PDZ domain-containing protein [Fimbriimonadaceae bacterium]|nr:PDZ domain-containing protein [Fimbriimonadaceae bacterium]
MITIALAALPLLATNTAIQAESEWPFKVMDHAIIVDSQVNGRNVSCMFDTGFSGSYVLNQSVNIGKPTGTMTLQDFVGTFEAPTVPITSLKMGSVSFDTKGMTVVQMPDENYSLNYGTHCDGIMGLEVVAHKVFQINFEKKKFIFYPQSYDINKFRGQEGKHVVKLLPFGNNSMEMSVVAHNGEKMHLALDTGNAFYSTTHKDTLERIGLWKTGVEPNYPKQSWVASGPVKSWDIEMKDVSIFGVPVASAVWNIIDRPSSSAEGDGTVGFGFLKNFNITVDMERRVIMLENWTGKVSDEPEGEVGISAFYSARDKRMLIYSVTPGSPAAKAGVKAGDFLIGLEGEVIENMNPYTLRDKLSGKPGTTVKISVSRNGLLERFELERSVMVNQIHK